jgi:hypothetical protein
MEPKIQHSRGQAVAPLATPRGKPIAWAGRSETSALPLEDWIHADAIGNPEASSAGVGASQGVEPPSSGASAPNFNTYGTTRSSRPSRSALFGSVWMTLDEYREGAAAELRRLALYHVVHGKRRRNFVKKASALLTCGRWANVPRCGTCGKVDSTSVTIECACDLRACPSCARRRANILRRRLDEKWCTADRPRDMGLYLLTFTLRYDPNSPDDLSVDGLKRRKKVVRDAVGFVWKHYLKPRGRAFVLGVEVSPRGAVHVHGLFHGRRPDVSVLRETYMFRAGDSPFVNCQYVRKPAKAIRELAKYMMKAASPKNPRVIRGGRGEFIHPVLAARAEVAFSGDRLFECMGAWRGADDDKDLPEQAPRTCPHCGACTWHRESTPLQTLISELPDDWVPRFGRAGPRSKTPAARNRGDIHV